MTIPDATEIVAELERLLPDWIEMEPGRWQRVEYALRAAEFHRLVEGHYEISIMSDGVYDSYELPGLSLPVAWLWQFPAPTLPASLRLLGWLD